MIPKMLTILLGGVKIKMKKRLELKRRESKFEVETHLDRLKYAIESDSVRVNFQRNRRIDQDRDKKYTNRYTIARLFPDEDEIDAIKKELLKLTIEDYIETVKDKKFPKKSEMRVFGKQYAKEDVYIKIRVELAHTSGGDDILVMSFHYSEWSFTEDDFPYKKV